MAKKIRTVHYGLGPVGARIARLVATRANLEIAGAVDIDPAKVGKDLGEVAEIGRNVGVVIGDKAESVFAAAAADIVIHTTSSSLKTVFNQLVGAAKAGLNVVSTCEELSFPEAQNANLVIELDNIARQNGVTILGTGINPGFVMDALPLFLTAPCNEVGRIKITRIVDASGRRYPLQKKVGAGMTVEEFREKVNAGVVKHVGIPESIAMIASTLGWRLDRVEETINPMVAEKTTKSDYFEVAPGKVTGVWQIGRGFVNGEERISLELKMHLGAEDPRDAIYIEGNPNIDMVIKGGYHGDISTAGMIVNAVKRVVDAPAGLVTMRDLPIVYNTASV